MGLVLDIAAVCVAVVFVLVCLVCLAGAVAEIRRRMRDRREARHAEQACALTRDEAALWRDMVRELPDVEADGERIVGLHVPEQRRPST